MRCILCGEQMRQTQSVPDDTMFVSGYAHLTFECVGCGEIDRRLVFRSNGEGNESFETQGAGGCHEGSCDTAKVSGPEPTDQSADRRDRPSTPKSWDRAIQKLRDRQNQLRQRAENERRSGGNAGLTPLCHAVPSAAARATAKLRRRQVGTTTNPQDVESRKRFDELWEGLAPRNELAAPTELSAHDITPLPRSLSLIVKPQVALVPFGPLWL
jgi:hypothetical protein